MLLFYDSFDLYNTLSQKWDLVAPSAFVSSSLSRTGRNSLSIGSSAGYAQKNLANAATLIVGIAVNLNSVPSNAAVPISFTDNSTAQVDIRINSSGQMFFTRAGTTIGSTTAGATFTMGVWHYLEVKVTFNGSSGVAICKLDGVTVLNGTSLNTNNSGNNFANQVSVGNRAASVNIQGNIDDCYICDTSGSRNNDFLGDVSILAGLPIANGSLNNYTNVFASWASSTSFPAGTRIKDSNGNVQQSGGGTSGGGSHPTWSTTGGGTTSDNTITWTCIGSGSNPGSPNWMAVSEYPPDDNNSYVTDATVSDQDRYTFAAIAGSAVHAVAVNIRAEKDDASNRTIRAVVKSGGTTADNGTDFGLTLNSYGDFQAIFETPVFGSVSKIA